MPNNCQLSREFTFRPIFIPFQCIGWGSFKYCIEILREGEGSLTGRTLMGGNRGIILWEGVNKHGKGAIKTENVPNCGKSPKVSAKIKIVYISNLD